MSSRTFSSPSTKRANRIPNGLVSSGRSSIATHTFSGKLTPITEPKKNASRLVHGTEDGKLLAGPKTTPKAEGAEVPDIKELSAFPVIDGLDLVQVKQPNNVPNYSLKVDVADDKAFPALAGPSKQMAQPSFPMLRIMSTLKHPRVAALKRNG
ncbi:hypothetical protein LTR65_001415 [Meristemomyces frigidus]